MTTSLLSPKFQIVIPKEIRQTLGLKPGQRLAMTTRDGRIEITPIPAPEQLVGFLKSDKPLVFEREPNRKF